MLHTHPAVLPETWLASKPLPTSDGSYNSFIVLHKVEGDHPYATHMAYFIDDQPGNYGTNHWEYCNGHYYENLNTAMADYEKRN